jgi:hypothetical protein
MSSVHEIIDRWICRECGEIFLNHQDAEKHETDGSCERNLAIYRQVSAAIKRKKRGSSYRGPRK